MFGTQLQLGGYHNKLGGKIMPDAILANALDGNSVVEGQGVSTTGEGQGQESHDDLETNSGQTSIKTAETEKGEQVDGGKSEPTSDTGLFDGMTGNQLHKSYKELQSKFTTTNQSLIDLNKNFDAYGGADSILEAVQALSNNPDFPAWYKDQQSKTEFDELGLDSSDPKIKEAVEIVEKLVGRKFQDRYNAEIKPLVDSQKQDLISKNTKAMDVKFGEDWRELHNTMAELSDKLPPAIQDNPSLENLEDLFWKAARESGRMDEMMKKVYQKSLESKKSSATTTPTSVSKGEVKSANTMREAYLSAKQKVG